jgi:chromosome segregation ATPase
MLGLGAKPNSIGRSDRIQDFIRKPCVGEDPPEIANVMIELIGSGDRGDLNRIFVERVITPGGKNGTSTFFLSKDGFNSDNEFESSSKKKKKIWHTFDDGEKRLVVLKQVTQEKIVTTVRGTFKIELGNVCQFLPQDIVNTFTGKNEKQLLEATQIAVLGQRSVDDQKKLIELSKREKNAEMEFRALEDQVSMKKDEVRDLRTQVDRLKDYEHNKRILETCRQKIIYKEYHEAYLQYENKKRKLLETHKEWKTCEKELEPMRKKIADKVKELEALEKEEIEPLAQVELRQKKTARRLLGKVESHSEKFEDLQNDLEAQEREARVNEQKIRAAEEMVSGLIKERETLAAEGDEETRLRKYEEISTKIRTLQAKKEERKEQREELTQEIASRERECNKVRNDRRAEQDKHSEKLRAVFAQDRSGFLERGFKRIRQLKIENKFQSEVYGPIAAEIVCTRRANLLEKVIGNNLLLSMVFTNKEDQKLFEREEPQLSKKLCINCTTTVRGPPRRYQPIYGMEFLDEAVNARPEIMSVLYDFSGVGNQLSAPPDFDARLNDRVMSEIRSRAGRGKGITFYTDKWCHRVKYNPLFPDGYVQNQTKWAWTGRFKTSLRTDAAKVARLKAREAELLSICEDRRNQKSTLTRADEPVNEEIQALHVERQHIREKILEFRNLCRKIKKYETQISARKEKDFARDIQKLKNDMEKAAADHLKAAEEWITFWGEKLMRTTMERKHRMKLDTVGIKTVLRDLNTRKGTLSSRCQKLKAVVDDLKRERKELLAVAKLAMDKVKDAGLNMEQLPESFKSVPDNLVDLKAKAAQLSALLSRSSEELNESLYDQYERAKDEHLRLIEKRKDFKDNLESQLAEYETKKGEWLKRTSNLVDKISRKFASNFMLIPSSAGKVELVTSEKFEDYGIRLMVRYRRGEDMQPLNHSAHSGGEKRVATAMYLLALQKLTPCPVRIVDEINQGMDAYNERITFGALVESVCGKLQPDGTVDENSRNSGSQFFVITPKLLPNLVYREEITVLCCFKAKRLFTSDEFDMNKFIGIKRKLRAKGSVGKKKRARNLVM